MMEAGDFDLIIEQRFGFAEIAQLLATACEVPVEAISVLKDDYANTITEDDISNSSEVMLICCLVRNIERGEFLQEWWVNPSRHVSLPPKHVVTQSICNLTEMRCLTCDASMNPYTFVLFSPHCDQLLAVSVDADALDGEDSSFRIVDAAPTTVEAAFRPSRLRDGPELRAALHQRHVAARIAFEARDLDAYRELFSADLVYRQANGRVIGRDLLMHDVSAQFDRIDRAETGFIRESMWVGETDATETLMQTARVEASAFGFIHRTWDLRRHGRYRWALEDGVWKIAQVEVLSETVRGSWKFGRA